MTSSRTFHVPAGLDEVEDQEEALPEVIDPAVLDYVPATINPGRWEPPTPTYPEVVLQEEE